MEYLWLDVVARWVHIGTAIVVLGGSVFLRLVLRPAARTLSDTDYHHLKAEVLDRWKRVVHAGIGLFLISGFYNYIRAMPAHKGDGLYHALIGTKILIALIMFVLISGLVGRSALFEPLRKRYPRWQLVTILLATIVVGISGYVKVALK